jgi:putative DNA primase/helicase
LSALLVALPRDAALSLVWKTSPPVPTRPRPPPRTRMNGEIPVELAGLQTLLDAIPNSGEHALGYDEWRNVVFAIHHETQGSSAGLDLAHAFSARAPEKYDPAFLDERVWPYVNSDGRTGVVGLGTLKRIAGAHGWHEPLNEAAFVDESGQDNQPPLPDASAVRVPFPHELHAERVERVDALTQPAVQDATLGKSMSLAAHLAHSIAALPARKGIPEAHALTTDQANANRIVDAFGRQVLVAAGRWHVWDGKRWAADEADIYRYGCRLSDLIRVEAKDMRARAALLTDPAEIKLQAGMVDALMKWSVKSEMKTAIENAIGLGKKMLTVPSEQMDADPWALNCANGIVDLRTGELRRHNPDEMITKCTGIAFRPHAQAPVWGRMLLQICRGDRELVAYLQRFFGYCLTGLTVEQMFAVLWGVGGNGKSTVLEAMARTMGDYAGTAAPNLLISTRGAGDRHPTEIAALMGKRMVIAHESGEGVVLREDFVKQATGGDTLTARYMRGDFFQFHPTHKLILVTNHKPQVRGQDEGIWRRVALVPFTAAFGTPEQVAAGTHTDVRDPGLLAALQDELEGILAWRVKGCVEWAARGGLDAPRAVQVASADYRHEQDRVAQFVKECCELDPSYRGDALTDGMGGVYPAYVSWCREGGVLPLSKTRFLGELLRVAGVAQTSEARVKDSDSRHRRYATLIPTVRLLAE